MLFFLSLVFLVTINAAVKVTPEKFQTGTTMIIKYGDLDHNSSLNQKEFKLLSTESKKYGFIMESKDISFGDVDKNNDGKVDESELYVLVSVALEQAGNGMLDGLNITKLESESKKIFVKAYEKKCGTGIDTDAAWLSYKQCTTSESNASHEDCLTCSNSIKKRDIVDGTVQWFSGLTIIALLFGVIFVLVPVLVIPGFVLLFLALIFAVIAFSRERYVATRNENF